MNTQIALPAAGRTLRVLDLLQALAQCGAVLVLDARLVCDDGVVVPLEPVQRRAPCARSPSTMRGSRWCTG